MLKRILCLIIALLILCPAVFADTLQVAYEPQSKVATVVGSNYTTGHFVKLVIPDLDGGFIYADQFEVDATGGFTKKIMFPQEALNGEYTLTSVTKRQRVDANFKVYNLTAANHIVQNQMNAAKSANEIKSVLEEKYDDLGLYEKDVLTKYASSVCDKLYQHKNKVPYTDAKDFTAWYYSFLVVSVISAEDAAVAMTNMAHYLIHVDIDSNVIGALSNEDKARLFQMVLSEGYLTAPLSGLFADNLVLLRIGSADRWSSFRDILEPKLLSLGLNQDLNALENTQQFFMDLYEKLDGNVKNMSEFKDAYQKLYDSSRKRSAGNNGGGNTGGGGGSTKNVTIPVNVTEEDGTSAQFTDVKTTDWFYEYVHALSGWGIISGFSDGSFRPDQSITRAEFCKLLVEAFGIPTDGGGDLFSDVKATDWFYPYVSGAAKHGLVFGYNNQFAPYDQIKRQDTAVILYRALNVNEPLENESDFVDKDEISGYALQAVAYLAKEGILKGNADNQFLPHKQLTRAEASKLIYLLKQ